VTSEVPGEAEGEQLALVAGLVEEHDAEVEG
jgi:hypothetical protein